MYELIEASPPLDLNSRYAYFLWCSHFADTSAVAVADDGTVAGFLSGYCPPTHPDAYFVWQIVVGEKARGQGVAARLIEDVLSRPSCEGVRYLEATVGPSNAPSRALFTRFAEKRGLAFEESEFLAAEMFGEGHEEEILLRIGPFERAAL